MVADEGEKSPEFTINHAPLPTFIELARLSRELLDGERGAEDYILAAEPLLRGEEIGGRVNLEYFMARFLALHGAESEAREYLQQVAGNARFGKWVSALAGVHLREWDADLDDPN